MVDSTNSKVLREHAPGIMEALVTAESSHSSEVISNWSGRMLGDLPSPCRDWLATRFGELDTDERRVVLEGLSTASTQDGLGKDEGEKYRAFMRALTHNGSDTTEIREHLDEVARSAVGATVAQGQGQQNPQTINAARQTAQSYLPEIMPVLASSLPLLSDSRGSELLNRVFAEALYISNAPELLGTLHSSMVGKWPSPEQVDYQAQRIFERAEQPLKNQPELEEAPALLRSVSSLTNSAELGADHTARVLDAACTVWPEHAEPAAEILTSYEAVPTPERLAALAQALEVTDEQEARLECLRAIWNHCAPLMDAGTQQEVAIGLLKHSRVEAEGDRDWALGVWIEALPDGETVLKAMISDHRLADEDLERLWRRIEGMASRLDFRFFREMLPGLLGRAEIDRTISAVRSSADKIIALTSNQTERNELARGLLEALIACPSDTGKGMLARWIDDASAQEILGHLNNLNPTEHDLDILQAQFPTSSRLQDYRRKRRPQSN